MAEATIELGRLLTTDFKLFDFEYQFDDSNYKAQLEENIIDFYYDYEIGFETPDMFKRKFKARWNRIMPYYNKLYNTTLLSYNPLTNYSITEALDQISTVSNKQDSESTSSANGKTTVNSTNTTDMDVVGNSASDSTTTNDLTNTTKGDEKTSDYPQQPIAGGDYLNGARTSDSTTTNKGTVTNASTGTNDTHTGGTVTTEGETTNTDSGTTIGNVTVSGTTDTEYSKTIEGITGASYPDLITKHRDALMRINDMIIEEMKKCFILVY